MPTYEYKCENCGHSFEIHHSMNEEPVVNCPQCQCRARKIITGGSGFILNGSRADYPEGNLTPQCGKEQTCCGRSTPCETRPCDK
ncbi:MAG: FmdB family zinc ribbon protein [Nitrospirota bacterium]